MYNPKNITEFQRFVLSQTGEGVHFMMADGVGIRLFVTYLFTSLKALLH